MDPVQALTTSIGEYSVATLGEEHLRALRVVMDPRTMQAQMLIELADNSDQAQRDALKEIFEVESVFADEAVLSYRFVEELDDVPALLGQAPRFSYA